MERIRTERIRTERIRTEQIRTERIRTAGVNRPKALQEGSLHAIYERHYVRLFRLSLALEGTREAAEDIAQEAFVRAAPRLESIDEASIGSYLNSVAVNIWKDSRRHKAIELKARALLGSESRTMDAEDRNTHRSELLEAMKPLSARQRAGVVLRYYEGFTDQEIAEVLGCSAGSVKRHISRALVKLRREMGNEL